MNAAIQKQKDIHPRRSVDTVNIGLPPEGTAYLSDGTPLNQSSFNAWKQLSLAERVQVNSQHLRHAVTPWHELLEKPISSDQIYNYHYIFMHVPKAGGTTLQHIIAKNYLPNQFVHANSNQIHKNPACLYHAKRQTVRPIVMGHFDRSCILYNLLGDRPIIHFTMFRDPVQRILSHYRYLQSNIVHGKHQEVKVMSLEEYASSNIKEIQNKQTLRILGDGSRAAQMQALNDPDSVFRAAKQVLEHEFSFFGLTEKYTQFLLMAKKVLKWEDIVYRRKNISPKPQPSAAAAELTETDKQGMNIIRERNQLDIRLYDFACELFESRYRELNLSPQAEAQYEQANQRYQSIIDDIDNI